MYLLEAAKRHKINIEKIEIVPEHVHAIVSLRPSMYPSKAIQILKGFSARILFLSAEPMLRGFYYKSGKSNSLWVDGKFMAPVGHITLDKAKEYVKNHGTYDAKVFAT